MEKPYYGWAIRLPYEYDAMAGVLFWTSPPPHCAAIRTAVFETRREAREAKKRDRAHGRQGGSMSFSDWKKRSRRYHSMMSGYGIGRADAEEVAQAAYKAGERDGRKQVEAVARNAIGQAVLAERERCANICDHEQGTAGDAADKIRSPLTRREMSGAARHERGKSDDRTSNHKRQQH